MNIYNCYGMTINKIDDLDIQEDSEIDYIKLEDANKEQIKLRNAFIDIFLEYNKNKNELDAMDRLRELLDD